MPNYNFAIDELIQTWRRTKFEITATTYEEAVEKAKEIFIKDEEPDNIYDTEILNDFTEFVTIEKNKGYHTRELHAQLNDETDLEEEWSLIRNNVL